MTTPELPTDSMRVKYQSRNPVVRWMVDGFLRQLDGMTAAAGAEAGTVLEVGCGEGFLTNRMAERLDGVRVAGMDDSRILLDKARWRFPTVPFYRGTIYQLPARDAAVDLVVACEVLEHLTDPEVALAELARVTRQHAVLSVPQEPLWRVLNMARGKYLRDWGNTAGHLQHWRPAQFVELVAGYFEIVEVQRPFPWTMVLAKRR